MKKILFITHEATRTGAPFVMLYFMQWLRANHKIHIDVLSLKDGGLREEFKQVANDYFLLPVSSTAIQNKISKFITKVKFKITGIKKMGFMEEISNRHYDIVYSNTIVSIPYGDRIKSINPNTKHVAHIHELNATIKIMLPDLSSYSKNIDCFIAASNLVKENLISNWAVPEVKVIRVYECSKVKTTQSIKKNKVFTIGGSGTVHWRKGCDLFLQVARYVHKNSIAETKIEFVWVGEISKIEKIIIEEDLRKLDLVNMVTFVGQQKETSSFYQNFDVFLMTSREDPFPLVCIEMGMFSKPIVCFKGATGSEEIISKGGGVIVPYLDIEAMGDQVISYLNNPEMRNKHGEINKNEFSKFSPEIICPQLWSVIEKTN